MSKWQIVSWQDVLTIKNGKSQKKVANPDGAYPIYGSGGVMGYADDYLCEAGTTVIGRKGSINNPLYVEEKFWNVDTAFGLCAGEKLDGRFLYYFCVTYNFLKHNKATTLPSLTKADLLRIKMPLPSLAEQKKIVAILDTANRLKHKNFQLIESHRVLSQSLFLEMFGDPVSNSKKWDVTQFSNCLDGIVGGKSVGGEERPLLCDEKAVIKISAVTSGVFNAAQYKVVEQANVPETLICPEKEDLLFTRANTREMVGATCVVDADYENLFLPDKIWRLDLMPTEASNWYIKFLLSHEGFRENLRKVATGTSGSMLNISKAKLRQLKVPLPPIALQDQFSQYIQLIEQQKQQAQASLEKSETLFNSLLQRAFKGELSA